MAGLSQVAVKDPVCGMSVNPETSKHRREHSGKPYYFCCGGCAEKFQADPEKYLKPKPAAGLVTLGAPVKPAGSVVAQITPAKPIPLSSTNYVCPMCPDVHATKPGPCPSCGIA